VENFSITLLLGAGVGGIIAWAMIAIYAFWRVGDARNAATKMADRVRLYEAALMADHRMAIWVWPDGRVVVDDKILSLLGLSGSVQSLEQLIEQKTGQGLPRENIVEITQAMSEMRPLRESILLRNDGDRADLLIDLQRIPYPEKTWPNAILWVEEMREDVPGSGFRGLEQTVRALQKFIDAVPFPVWQRDGDLNLVRVNKAYVKAVDADNAHEVLEKGLELTQAITRPRPHGIAAKMLQSGKPLRERQFAIINGQRRALSLTNVPMGDGRAFVGVAVDVTGEEEALSELGRVLDAQTETLNRLRSPVAIFGPNKTLRFFNNAFRRFSALQEDWLSQEPSHSELLDAMREKRRVPEQVDFAEWTQNIMLQYTELMEPEEDIWYLVDGTTHRVLTQPHPLGGLQVVLEDLSDHLALERSYNTLIAVQKETIDSLFESVVVFGSDGLMKLYNPSFQKLWHLSEEQLVGDVHFNDILKITSEFMAEHEHWHLIIAEFKNWFTERKVHTGRFIQPNNTVVDYTVVPLPDGAVMVRMIDVSDTLRIQATMAERNAALETADRLKSEFITNMSYELRTPINSIVGFTEMLQGGFFGEVNDKQMEYLSNIHSASNELSNMIADVLDIAVVEAGTMVLEVTEIDVTTMLQGAADDARPRADRSGVNIAVVSDKDIGCIEGDQRRIQRVVSNLFLIALRLADAGAELIATAKPAARNMVCISLCDTKMSLLNEEWLMVREAFDKQDKVGPRGGMGLDFALVRSFIQLHHGRIELGGTTETGLEINCYLPRKQPTDIGPIL